MQCLNYNSVFSNIHKKWHWEKLAAIMIATESRWTYFLGCLSNCGNHFKAIEDDKNSQSSLPGNNSKKVFKAALVLYPDQWEASIEQPDWILDCDWSISCWGQTADSNLRIIKIFLSRSVNKHTTSVRGYNWNVSKYFLQSKYFQHIELKYFLSSCYIVVIFRL